MSTPPKFIDGLSEVFGLYDGFILDLWGVVHDGVAPFPDTLLTLTLLKKAVNYLFPAMVGSSISTIVIFVPFILMTGVAGAYFKVMTSTMIITLVCSFFVTWICLPVIYLLLTGKQTRETIKKEEHHVKKRAWVSFFIHKPIISIVIIAVLACVIVPGEYILSAKTNVLVPVLLDIAF